MVYSQDFSYTYEQIMTMKKLYLTKANRSQHKHDSQKKADDPMERPQHSYMREALGVRIHLTNLKTILQETEETYKEIAVLRHFTFATPTKFNAGLRVNQEASCFLKQPPEDSIEGIFDGLKESAQISKHCGGIGEAIHCIRSEGSLISTSGGASHGIVPMMQLHNTTARYCDQGGDRRKGSIAIYIEPWHADILKFLDAFRLTGTEESITRDLFGGLWIPDLFMERVAERKMWTLFDPHTAPGLHLVWGVEFKILYERYEQEGRGIQVIFAPDLQDIISRRIMERGLPYILFKDSCNAKSNHKHLGTIQCSNLCTEIIQYTSPTEIAVCNLASLSLPSFFCKKEKKMDWDAFERTCHIVVRDLNHIIDGQYYPVEKARVSNMRHRPLGIGIQGLQNVCIAMGVPFCSPLGREINADVYEHLYHGTLSASCNLAISNGRTYESFPGSCFSKGILQVDMWDNVKLKMDWDTLRDRVRQHGTYNSLLTAQMPTASTAHIFGNVESMEPQQSNIFMRKVLAGEFPIVNADLMSTLRSQNKWNRAMYEQIIQHDGSIQNIPGIDDDTKAIFQTAYELKQKDLLDMSRDRAPFLDQSQSMNVFFASTVENGRPLLDRIRDMQNYGWKIGLKTGSYYCRTKSASKGFQHTVTSNTCFSETDLTFVCPLRRPLSLSSSSSSTSTTEKEEQDGCLACSA